jgi:hypothetical protein
MAANGLQARFHRRLSPCEPGAGPASVLSVLTIGGQPRAPKSRAGLETCGHRRSGLASIRAARLLLHQAAQRSTRWQLQLLAATPSRHNAREQVSPCADWSDPWTRARIPTSWLYPDVDNPRRTRVLRLSAVNRGIAAGCERLTGFGVSRAPARRPAVAARHTARVHGADRRRTACCTVRTGYCGHPQQQRETDTCEFHNT